MEKYLFSCPLSGGFPQEGLRSLGAYEPEYELLKMYRFVHDSFKPMLRI